MPPFVPCLTPISLPFRSNVGIWRPSHKVTPKTLIGLSPSSHLTYCTGIGSLKPSFSCIATRCLAGTLGSKVSVAAGPPGAADMIKKEMIVIPSRVGIAWTKRLRMNFPIRLPYFLLDTLLLPVGKHLVSHQKRLTRILTGQFIVLSHERRVMGRWSTRPRSSTFRSGTAQNLRCSCSPRTYRPGGTTRYRPDRPA